MKRTRLRFGRGFRVAIGNRRAQAAEMVLEPGKAEGSRDNRHRGADQWLYVISGTGVARVNGRRIALRAGTLLLIEARDEHERQEHRTCTAAHAQRLRDARLHSGR